MEDCVLAALQQEAQQEAAGAGSSYTCSQFTHEFCPSLDICKCGLCVDDNVIWIATASVRLQLLHQWRCTHVVSVITVQALISVTAAHAWMGYRDLDYPGFFYYL
jgi:hypothetical protein